MGKAGRRTPIWENKKTGGVVCGTTIQDALGVGWLCPVNDDWKHVSTLPSERHIIIAGGAVLPENDVSRVIARDAKTMGLLKILACGREYSCYVQYLDSVKAIISWGGLCIVSSHAVCKVLQTADIIIDLLHFWSAADELEKRWSLCCISNLARQIEP